jgi:hypothetical protein
MIGKMPVYWKYSRSTAFVVGKQSRHPFVGLVRLIIAATIGHLLEYYWMNGCHSLLAVISLRHANALIREPSRPPCD